MTITRISAAELFSKPHKFTAEEDAFFERATDEELLQGALADPDAQPWTPEMFRRAQAERRRRLAFATLEEGLGAVLEAADLTTQLPLWEVTDGHGQTVTIQAASVRGALEPVTAALKIVVKNAASAPQENEPAPAKRSTRQT